MCLEHVAIFHPTHSRTCPRGGAISPISFRNFRATTKNIWAKPKFFGQRLENVGKITNLGQRQGVIWPKQNFCALKVNTKFRKKLKILGEDLFLK